MKKIRLAPVVGVLGLAMCSVVFVGDLQVRWSIDGLTSAGKCSEYGVAKWQIMLYALPGRQKVDDLTVVCGDAWDTGEILFGSEEGDYALDMIALDSGGKELANKGKEFRLLDDGRTIWTVTLDFTAADFGGAPRPVCGNGRCEGDEETTCPKDCPAGPVCGDGKCETGETHASCAEDCPPPADASLHISWKINGTVDGTATGTSFDSCAEVGATKVAITLDGQTTQYPCADNDQSAMIPGLVAGEYQVSLVLQDESGDLTTAASDKVIAATTPQEEPFEFYFDSFKEPKKSSITGDYLFLTLFESALKCSQTNPQVGMQVVLLQLDGTPVPGQTCGPGGSSCLNLNNNDFGVCWEQPQTIGGLPWGAYKLAVQGVPVGKTTICWETKHQTDGTKFVDILVGAGNDNPVMTVGLDRVDSTGDCAPL